MPDLSNTASAKYWSEFPDISIYRVITFMESVESWTLDGDPELEAAITKLGQELDNVSGIDFNKLEHEDQFLYLIANIKTSRGLRLLQAIDQAQPGSASKVLMYAEETSISPKDAAGFFLKRNIIFERLRLLSRAFANDRIKMIAQVLGGDE